MLLHKFFLKIKQLFRRSKHKEKLKVLCQHLINNLHGNGEYSDENAARNYNSLRKNSIDYRYKDANAYGDRDSKVVLYLNDIDYYSKEIEDYSTESNVNTEKMPSDNDSVATMSNKVEFFVYDSSSSSINTDLCSNNNFYAVPCKISREEVRNSIAEFETKPTYGESSEQKIASFVNSSMQESEFFHLKEEIDYESQKIKEISKLFDTFKTNVHFYGSPEHLEAEKLMLLGCYRRNYLIECIRDNHYEDTNKNPAIVGSMKLCDFRVPLQLNLSNNNNFTEWFLCIVSCGGEIFISEPVRAELNWMRFEEMFHFRNVYWDSVIDVNIYSMRIPKLGSLKKLLNKSTNNRRQSKKLLYKDLRTYDMIECDVKNSMFKLCAIGKIYAQDRRTKEIKLDVIEPYALDNKMFIKSYFDQLRYVSKYSGFLTIGNEINDVFIWNRKWCVLDGSTFKCWNYPNDEEFKSPITVLDLKDSKHTIIRLADRSKCPKIRTFLLEFNGNRYYFSADTLTDLNNWTNILKEVIACLRGWNV